MPESPAPKFELIGTTVGNYTITRKLSRGGMGTVYGAQHALLGNAAAVKVLRPEFSNNKDIVNRFFKEAKATTSIKHPGIVEVWDYGYLASGDAYIVMEFLEGQTLAKRIKRGGRFQEGAAAMLVRGVCSGLAAAHDKGIVHRDLKPDNLFLVPDAEAPLGERIKILDFGIAKLTDVGLADTATKTGAVMGTPTYMSPEQCKGTGDIDLRADLYSLGCILYELLCGRPPFTKLGSGELIGAHLHVTPEPPSKHEPGISAPMEALIMSLLAKDPAERPSSAPALSRELAAIARDHGFATTSPSLPSLAQPLPPVADDHPALESKFAVDVEVSGTATIQDPTTLSGAANSKPIAHAPKRRGLRVSIAIAAAGLAGGLVLARMTSSSEAPAVSTTPAAIIMPARATAPPAAPPAPAPVPIVTAPAPTPTPTPTIAAAPVKSPAIAPKKKHKKPVAAVSAGSNAAPANLDLHGPVVDDL